MTIKKLSKVIAIGDSVDVQVGASLLRGKVVEDRGSIGVRGRKLYRVALMLDTDLVNIELPVDQIKRVGKSGSGKALFNAMKIGEKDRKPKSN